MDVQRVARFTFLRCSPVHFSTSLIASIHARETLVILIAQRTRFVEALASTARTVIFEANELVARWTVVTSSSLVGAYSLDTCGTAATIRHVDGRVDTYNFTVLELIATRVNTNRIVLLTGENVLVTLIFYPRDVVWVGGTQVLA